MTEATQAAAPSAKVVVPQGIKIELDKSRTHSTCHGDRTQDDPMYKVAFWQGGTLKGRFVQLPFDVNGQLVEDDGRTEPYQGSGFDPQGKPAMVRYDPLYSPIMREYLSAKIRKQQAIAEASAPAHEIHEEGDDDEILESAPMAAEDEVNFISWLKGEAKYPPALLRAAAKKRFGRNFARVTPDMVQDLVLDEKLVREEQVCPELARFLPKAA